MNCAGIPDFYSGTKTAWFAFMMLHGMRREVEAIESSCGHSEVLHFSKSATSASVNEMTRRIWVLEHCMLWDVPRARLIGVWIKQISNSKLKAHSVFRLTSSLHTWQLSRNILDSPGFTALFPCPARKRPFTFNVQEAPHAIVTVTFKVT